MKMYFFFDLIGFIHRETDVLFCVVEPCLDAFIMKSVIPLSRIYVCFCLFVAAILEDSHAFVLNLCFKHVPGYLRNFINFPALSHNVYIHIFNELF